MSTEVEPQGAESKYELRETIGKGAFGEVNLVVEKQSKQRFVLKRIKMARQSEWQRKATRQEIEIVSRLKHPFIMPYKEHWTHHGHTINVVYGYCEKGDLTTAVAKQKGKPFSEEMLRLWLAELLLAVEYMHRANVLHRDIKTQNILLTGEGDVQIGDFGLSTVRVPSGEAMHTQIHVHPFSFGDDTDTRTDASPLPHRQQDGSHGGAVTPEHGKPPLNSHQHGGVDAFGPVGSNANGHHAHVLFNAPPGASPHGQTNDRDKDQLGAQTPVHDPKAGTRNDYALVGTPHFMSPELLSNQKYSFETDIWSLGVVMFELTTLKPPFNAFNLAGLVAKIKRAALPPLPTGYSADWGTLLKSMLRKDPARRATALELLTMPSMQRALQQAFNRARTMDPNYRLPPAAAASLAAAPVASPNVSSGGGFSFDVGGPCSGAATQRTPITTPVLARPAPGSEGAHSSAAAGANSAAASESESSPPMSKFPTLEPTTSGERPAPSTPRSGSQPPRPMPRSTTAPRLHTTPPAAATAAPPVEAKDAGRSRTPGMVRGRAATGAAAPVAGTPPPTAVARRAPTPQNTRPAAVPARSKTPVRSTTPVPALSPRNRPVAPPQTTAARKSAGEESGSGTGTRIVRKASIPAEARGRVAQVSTPNALPATPPPKAGSAEKPRGSPVPSLLTSLVVPQPPADGADGNEHPAGGADGEGTRASTPTSVTGSLRSQASGTATTVAPTTSAPKPKDQAAIRPARTPSFTNRVARTSGTGGAAPPARDGPAAPIAASSPTAAGASGQKRRPAAPESTPPGLHAGSSFRQRAAAAATAATPPPGPGMERRRSQPGTAAVTSKDAPDAAGPREKRVRRSSYVSYGQTTPQARRQTGTPSPATTPAATPALAKEASSTPRDAETLATPTDTDYAVEAPVVCSTTAAPLHADSSAGCSAGGCSVESFPAAPAEAAPLASEEVAGTPEPDEGPSSPTTRSAAALAVGSAATATAGAGDSGHPWRSAVRSRSFVSMTTEDSELSIPDGRYAVSPEVSTGGGFDTDNGAVDSAPTAVAALPVPSSGIGAAAASQPLWSSNQLFSGNFGSFGGALAEAAANGTAAAATDAAGTPTPDVGRSQDPLAQSMDLPRRVSVSAFSPHLLAKAAADASAACNAPTSPGGGSTAESTPTAATARQRSAGGLPEAVEAPVAEEGEESAEAPVIETLTPTKPTPLPPPGSPGSFSSLSAPASDSSPSVAGLSPPRLATDIHMLSLAADRAPALVPAQPQQRRRLQVTAGQGFGAGRPYRRPGRVAQQAVMRAHRELENSIRPSIESSGSPVAAAAAALAAQQRPACLATQLFEEPSFGGSLGGSSTASVHRSFGGFAIHVPAPQQVGPAAWRITGGGNSSAANSSADATSTLRPVAEEGGDEAESTPPPAAADAATGAVDGGALGASEREQLALLQRVVSVAGSLLEVGRTEELYSVLSSTLSRPLARPAAAAQQAGAVKRPELRDRVRVVAGPFRGVEAVVRFRGPCHWCTGEVLGLELPPSTDGAEAASGLRGAAAEAGVAGARDGVLYFRCQQQGARTAFVAPEQVSLLG